MASQVCSLCGETVTGNMQVHLMSKCQGGDRNSEDEGSSSLSPPPSLSSSKTVNVRFLFKPLTNLSFKTVTLLSSFSIDLISNGMTYTSDYTQLPVGDYDGQLIIGSSVCYAVKKFVIDTSGETIPLELDLKQMDTDEKSSGSYTTEGSTIPVTDQTISMTFNPSYTTAVCNNPFCKVHGKARGYTNAYTYDSYGNGVYDDGSYGDEVYEGEGGQRKVLLVYYKYGEGEEGLYPATTDYQTATPTSYKSAPPTSYKSLPGKQRVTSNSPPTSDGETTPTKSTAESEDVSPVKRKQEKHQRSESPPPSHSPPPPLSPATTPPPSPPPSSPPPPLSTASKTPSSSRTQPASRTQSSLINNPKPSPPPPPVSTTPPVHEVSGLSANKTSSTGYTSSPPTHSNEPTTGFHVADIKSPAEDVSALKEENKRLKENMERAKALWEGQRRRLEQRLAQLEGGGGGGAKSTSLPVASTGDDEKINELECLVEELREQLEEKEGEVDDKERELTEAKDRITALENQMVEYASLMNDQSKTIQSTHHYTQQSAKLQELYSKAMEFCKKQQIEYQEKISSLEKDIEKVRTLSADSTVKIEVMEKLKAEVEGNRSQMKSFLKEMEAKDRLIQSLQDRLSGKPDPKFGELELVTLQEKCDAWRDRAESLSNEMDELKSLLAQLSIDKLAAEEQLEQHLKSQSSSDSRHDSMRQVQELQSLRLKMENTIHSLRAEKAELSQRNAELVESCDPEKYAKLKKEVVSMSKKLKEKETEISKLTESLHFHTEGNRELKEHLDAALNEETIAKIEQRISKYKTERDTTKEAMKTLRASCDEQLSLKESTILSLREELLKYQEEKQAWAVKYKKRKSELSELKKGSKEAIAKLHSQLQEKEQLLQSLAAHDTDRDDDDDDDDDGGGNSDANQEAEHVHVSNEEEMEEDNELYLTAVNDSFQSGPSAPTTKHSTDIKQKTSPSLSRHTRSSIHKSSKEAIPCHTHLRGASKATTSTSSQVIVRTKTGEKQSVIVPGVLEEMPIGSIVVVKRKDGIYEQGLLRYVGKEQCGVELELPREGTNGKNYDGTYKDGQRYFHCRKGHGLYTLPSNVFKIIS